MDEISSLEAPQTSCCRPQLLPPVISQWFVTLVPNSLMQFPLDFSVVVLIIPQGPTDALIAFIPKGSPPSNLTPSEEPGSEQTSPVLDAPEFPDFDNPEIETEAVDLATLNLEALDLVSSELPVPGGLALPDFADPLPALPSCDPGKPLLNTTTQDLNLENRISFDPVGFSEPINISEFPPAPAPEQWFHSEEVSIDPQTNTQADEADLGTAPFHSSVQEMDSSNHVSLEDGAQSHSRQIL